MCRHRDACRPASHPARLCCRRLPPGAEVELGMRVRLVDGDEVISDSDEDGGFQGACAKFQAWVRARYA